MADIIQPRVLKGFRDFLPEAEMARRNLSSILERVFLRFGFLPIDTPVLEYAEILLGKGGGETDKQVYRFTDHGGREVAMRFDLTVPFARFMAEHVDELYLPFRRYHMAKVWRGENTQRGRYREFMQCDFDIVGTDSSPADADIVLTIDAAMKALDVGDFVIRVNHRGIFNRFLAALGLGQNSADVLRAVDRLEKVGEEAVLASLTGLLGAENAHKILDFIRPEATSLETLAKLEALAGGIGPDSARMREVFTMAEAAGAGSTVRLDPSITRGLDYYTGIVFETTLLAAPTIGSVCSGGRYDELASLYTTRRLPGVGASVGLDRLLAALEMTDSAAGRSRAGGVLFLYVDPALLPEYQRLAALIRAAGITAELFPEPRKLSQQFAYAEKKGFRSAIILGGDEKAQGLVTVKDLASRESHSIAGDEALLAFLTQPLHKGSE